MNKRRVLVVEDGDDWFEIIKQSFEKKGIECHRCANLLDSEAFNVDIDLIIHDTLIPSTPAGRPEAKYGYESMIHLKERYSDALLIIISGEDDYLEEEMVPAGLEYIPLQKIEEDLLLQELSQIIESPEKRIKKYGKNKKFYLKERLSNLREYLCYLFLPLDIDLQVLRKAVIAEAEGKRREGGISSREYLGQVLKGIKSRVFYQRKLADLQYILVKEKLSASSEENVAPSDEVKSFMERRDSILDLISIIEDEVEEDRQQVEKMREILLRLGGVCQRSGNYYKDTNSPISQFMYYLDQLKEKQGKLGEEEIGELEEKEELLKKLIQNEKELFEELIGEKGELFKENPLHIWFSALLLSLDRLIGQF